MNVKRVLGIILLFLILFSAVSAISAYDDNYYTIDQGFIDLNVKDNGLLHVNESYVYSFHGEYNGIYRDITLKQGETIDNIQVSADGAYPVLKQSDENGQKHLKIYLYADEGHTQKIKDCKVRVHISYDMENTVTLFNDVGGLQYQLWGKDWDVALEKLNIKVTLPGDSNNTYYLNPKELTATQNIKGDTITAETHKLPQGEIYEILVLMPLDDFNDDANYARHVHEDGKEKITKNLNDSISSRNFWNTTYMILSLLCLLFPLIAVLTYFKYGREPKVDYDGIYERELPTDDPPEVINAIIDNKKVIGTPNMKGFQASIMNLIDRKVFKIYQNENEDLNDLVLTFDNDKVNGLSKSEKIIFDTLKYFSQDNVLNLTQLDNQLSSESEAKWFMDQFEEWGDTVEEKINLDEYFIHTGSDIIKGISFIGIIYGIIIAVLGFTTNLHNGFYALIAGILLVIFSGILIYMDEDIFGRWSEEGRVFYLKWSNLKKFLKDNSLIKEHPPESVVIWRKYLIYGTALGVADKVYDAMKLQIPNISEYDDGLFMYHYYGGYHMMYHAFNTGQAAANPSSSSVGDFGGFGGGSGGGGGGAF